MMRSDAARTDAHVVARTVPRKIWVPAAIFLLLSGILSSLLKAELPLAQTRSSYGAVPYGWGAAYDLLHELDSSASRSREPLARRPARSTQWVIDPAWGEQELEHELALLQQFVHGGGTLVLIAANEQILRGLGVAPLVSARPPAESAPNPADDGQPADALLEFEKAEATELTGAILPRARSVELTAHSLFEPSSAESFAPRAQTGEGAFVLERTIGSGKLVLVAGADFLTNERLANVDNAPFLVDLRRAYGAPVFDERCHGFSADRSLWSVLGGGFFCVSGLALLAASAAALQSARRWPLAQRGDEPAPPPTLEVFVSSLASLYQARGRRDAKAVFRAYRAGYMRRLQRLMFGQREISQAHFEARVQNEASKRGPDGRWLLEDAQPSSSRELLQAVASLERYAGALSPRARPTSHRSRARGHASTTQPKRQA